MNALNKREVIVEIERVQVVRKRAKTLYMICKECGRKVDFVSLNDASTVFETEAADLVKFATANRCHIRNHSTGGVHICLVAFIAAMKRNHSRIKLVGEQFNHDEIHAENIHRGGLRHCNS